jgi:hypothetical protein
MLRALTWRDCVSTKLPISNSRRRSPIVAERAARGQHAQRRLAPVHQPGLDLRRVVAPRGEIGLAQEVAGQRAGDFGAVDREIERAGGFRGREAGPGAADHIVDGDVLVVIGKALRHAVTPCQLPASRQRGDTGIEFCLQRRRNRPHGLISTSGIFGIAPAAKADRSTSR